MYRPCLLTWYIGLLAGAAIGNFSAAVLTRSANTNPHYDIMDTETAFLQAVSTDIQTEDATTVCLPTMNILRVLNLRDQALEALEPETGGASVGEEEEDREELPKSRTAADIAKELAGTKAETCESGATANANKHIGLVIPFEYSTTFDCGSLIQDHFAAGLSHMQESNFDPATGAYDTGKAPFDNLSASNVANIMWSKSTKASCAVTKNCQAGHNVLYCRLVEPITNADKPFTTELYEALLQRQAGSSSIALTSIATTFFCAALLLLS
ncbi:SAG family member [Eimeria tenella]|uniref:SAG family member n=1 Tax=Eimeria tenella TaxID=5802 RepID=U6KGU2_EIMTE|nr:SAG family member [Eimeria tenella]CDJ37169.1 SAG family member [Eimeria tenella]|eukprot:XP_013228007.1 SAG family member [Eimeria tenella]